MKRGRAEEEDDAVANLNTTELAREEWRESDGRARNPRVYSSLSFRAGKGCCQGVASMGMAQEEVTGAGEHRNCGRRSNSTGGAAELARASW